MDGLFARLLFAGFGPSLLDETGMPPHTAVRGPRSGVLRARVRAECPRQPGIYGMLDATGKLIYVGKAKSLRSRLLSYFRPKSRDPKAGHIVRHTRTLVWECQPSEFAALLRELELIRRWRPRFNVQGQPHRRRSTYLCLGRRPAPYLFASARPPSTTLMAYGPLPAGSQAREVARRLNDAFALRDCPQKQVMVFADQSDLFPMARAAGCIRHEIGTCLGPCAAACTRQGYAVQVEAARAFLEGRDRGILQNWKREMELAAAALHFERAAALRDRIVEVEWLLGRLDRLRRVRSEHTFVYPQTGSDGIERWYLIHQGCVHAGLRAPRCPVSAVATRRALEAAFRRKHFTGLSVGGGELDGILLVAGWFRKHPEEKARALSPEAALDRCRVTEA